MNVLNDLFIELYTDKFGEKINRQLAESLVENFAITDNSERTTGEKWTFEEAKALGEKNGVNFEKIAKSEFYLVLNMMYSDFYKTAKKHGLNESFFLDLTCDWFNDVDAPEHKTFDFFIHL